MRVVPGLVVVGLVAALGWWLVRSEGPDGATQHEPSAAVDELGAAPRDEPAPSFDVASPPASEPLALPAEVTGADEAPLAVIVRTGFIGEDESPGPGIVVDLGVTLNRYRSGDAITTCETDAEGVARGQLPRSALVDQDGDGPVGVFARVDSDFIRRVHKIVQVPRGEAEPVEIVLTMKREVRVVGRLVDAHDNPIRGRVRPQRITEDGGLGSSGSMATTDADGRFDVGVLGLGRVFLHAEGMSAPPDASDTFAEPQTRSDRGTGVSEPFDVVWREPVPEQVIRVTGPGRLHGRVLDDAGLPAAGLRLQASAHEGLGWFEDRTTGGGHSYARGQTDVDGRFDLGGLRDGLFTIAAATGRDDFDEAGLTLTPEPVPSTGPALELRLTRPHLVVRVFRADGSPASEVERLQWSPFGLDDVAWPDAPKLNVTVARDHEPDGWRRALVMQDLGPGEFSADVEVGKAYDVSVFGGATPWTTQRIEVPSGSGRQVVDVTLPDPVGLGTLVLDVTDAAGQPLVDDMNVRLIDRATGAALIHYEFPFEDADDWPQRIPVPAGLHWLVVEDAPYIDSHHGTVLTRRAGGRFETDLAIQAGSDTVVHARLSQGAKLRLRVDGSVRDEDREAVQAGMSRFDPEDESSVRYVDYWAPHVSVQLLREHEWPEAVQFKRYGFEGTSAAGNHLWSTVAFGSEEVSEVVSPGRVTLVVRARGGREARRDLELLEGQTHDVVIDLQ